MGPYLATPNKEKFTEISNYNKMKFAASSMQGWRNHMEDAHISKFNIVNGVHLFGVFDGHGGKEVSKFVERHFTDELLANKNFKDKNYSQALHETFLKMDELLLTTEGKQELKSIKSGESDQLSEEEDPAGHCGCTACVCLIADGKIFCANAGDARCVLYSEGKAIALSEDHKPDLVEEKGRIQNAGGYVLDGRINGDINVSRGMGDLAYKKNAAMTPDKQMVSVVPDIREHVLTKEDQMIVMGCDGIWEILSNQQICEFVEGKLNGEKTNVGEAVEALLEKIIAPDTKSKK